MCNTAKPGIWVEISQFFLTILHTANAKAIHFDANTTGANDGSYWVHAFNFLQEALATEKSGDEIWIIQGTYKSDEDTDHPNSTGGRGRTFRLSKGIW